MNRCKTCKEHKPKSKFRTQGLNNYMDSICKECRREEGRVRWKRTHGENRPNPVIDNKLFELFLKREVMPPLNIK